MELFLTRLGRSHVRVSDLGSGPPPPLLGAWRGALSLPCPPGSLSWTLAAESVWLVGWLPRAQEAALAVSLSPAHDQAPQGFLPSLPW